MIYSILLMAWLGMTNILPPLEDLRATTSRSPDSMSEVAGIYSFDGVVGDGRNLTIAPDGRFSFKRFACLGVTDKKAGSARIASGHLLLSSEGPNERTALSGMNTDFVIVKWGRCVYLVPETDKEEFCDRINVGRLPLSGPRGDTYCRLSEAGAEGTDLSTLPKDWLPLILKKSLHGRVIEVMESRIARIDIGKESGVWKGMTLVLETKSLEFVKVTEVGQDTCVIAGKYPRYETVSFKQGQTVRSTLGKTD